MVWARIFSGENGLYLTDGTAFRFLATYEGDQFHELTSEAWSEQNRRAWENLLTASMTWADQRMIDPEWKPRTLNLDQEAQVLFLDWRNDLYGLRGELPEILRGFIPKIVGYALRLAGVLYCMDRFSYYETPAGDLTTKDMQRGIDTAMFYLGHIVGACKALCGEEGALVVADVSEQSKHLAETLEAMRGDIDSGRLAIGYIQERFNATCKPEMQITTPRAMGAFIRSCGLTVPDRGFKFGSSHNVRCLTWDKKTEEFLKHVPHVPHIPQACSDEGLQPEATSPQRPTHPTPHPEKGDMWDVGKTTSHPEEQGQDRPGGHVGHVGLTSKSILDFNDAPPQVERWQ